MTDARSFSESQVETRIDAFMEMLKAWCRFWQSKPYRRSFRTAIGDGEYRV